MTYIEFFDKTALENVCACLTSVPERVILIGNDTKAINKAIVHYRRVFEGRGHKIEFLPKSVSRTSLESAIGSLQSIVDAYPDCVFDITGGDEMMVLALGAVYAKNPDKNIQIHRFNLVSNVMYDCDRDGNTVFCETPTLSVEENVQLYGGSIVYGGVNEDKTYKWDLTEDFIHDVNSMWNVGKGNPQLWNVQIGVFEVACEVGSVSEDGLSVIAPISVMKAKLAKKRASYTIINGIVRYLLREGLITDFDEGDGMTLKVSFKNEQVKKCLTKAGQILELHIYLCAKNLFDAHGVPIYDDVVNGALIDWDGELHNEKREDIFDTENEIDVLMMHDTVPVFISCKNGEVTSDELYKLDTVAWRFGGKYAKRVLAATSISHKSEAGKYLRQRIDDMGIILIDDVHRMSDEMLANQLAELWKK